MTPEDMDAWIKVGMSAVALYSAIKGAIFVKDTVKKHKEASFRNKLKKAWLICLDVSIFLYGNEVRALKENGSWNSSKKKEIFDKAIQKAKERLYLTEIKTPEILSLLPIMVDQAVRKLKSNDNFIKFLDEL